MAQTTTGSRNSTDKRRAGHISAWGWVAYGLMVFAFVAVTIASIVFR